MDRTTTNAEDEAKGKRPSPPAAVRNQEENVKTLIRMKKIPMMEMMEKAMNPMAGRRAGDARKRWLGIKKGTRV